MATNPRQSEREQTMEQDTRRAAEQTAKVGQSFAEAGERTARSGADAARRNADAVKATWRNGTETAGRIAERSADQFSRMVGMGGDAARQTVQQSTGNIQAVMESGTIVAGGVQDIVGEWLRFAQGRAEQMMEHFDNLAGCRSPHELFALQTQIVRDNFAAFLNSARATSERSTRIAEEAARKMSSVTLAPE